MTTGQLRLRDFALEARARHASAITYGEAEMAAARRLALAEGEAAGRAAAEAIAQAAQSQSRAEIEQLARDAAAVRAAADAVVLDALSGLERAFAAALSAAAPALAGSQTLAECAAAFRRTAQTVRLPAIAARAAPAIFAQLQAAEPPLPAHLHLVADPALPAGSARLDWQHGGAAFQPDAVIAAVQAVVTQALAASRFPDEPKESKPDE